jgi:hypothetical protein
MVDREDGGAGGNGIALAVGGTAGEAEGAGDEVASAVGNTIGEAEGAAGGAASAVGNTIGEAEGAAGGAASAVGNTIGEAEGAAGGAASAVGCTAGEAEGAGGAGPGLSAGFAAIVDAFDGGGSVCRHQGAPEIIPAATSKGIIKRSAEEISGCRAAAACVLPAYPAVGRLARILPGD